MSTGRAVGVGTGTAVSVGTGRAGGVGTGTAVSVGTGRAGGVGTDGTGWHTHIVRYLNFH